MTFRTLTTLVALTLLLGCAYKPFFGGQRSGQQTQEVPRTKY